MNKKGVIGAGFLLVLLIIIGGLFVKVMLLGEKNVDDSTNDKKVGEFSIEKNGFSFSAKYQDENMVENIWDYKITGSLPSPCHEAKVQEIVLESYPEQVSVVLTITPPASDVICAQVIQDMEKTGTFLASEKAKVSFLVD